MKRSPITRLCCAVVDSPQNSVNYYCTQDMIQEQFAEVSDYGKEREGCLRLLFDSRVMENDQPLAHYLVPREGDSVEPTRGREMSLPRLHQRSWAKPFVGIVWVIPFRPLRTTAIDWAAQAPTA